MTKYRLVFYHTLFITTLQNKQDEIGKILQELRTQKVKKDNKQ